MSHTKDEDRQVDEGVKRGSRAVHPVAQSPEALEPAERALDHIALPLEAGVLGVQLARRLLGRDAPSGGDDWPEAVIVDKLLEPEAVVALISQQRRLGGLGRVGQDVAQGSVVIVAGGHADGEWSPRPINQQRQR